MVQSRKKDAVYNLTKQVSLPQQTTVPRVSIWKKKPIVFFSRPQDGIDMFERVGRESNSAMFATASFLMMYQEQAVRERERMRYRAIDES